jgi:Dolichyl-phosphate-mannose-protein mannosyltransferase
VPAARSPESGAAGSSSTAAPGPGRRPDSAEILLGALLLLVSAVSVAGLVLAEAGWFGPAALTGTATAVAAVLVAVAWRSLRVSGAGHVRTPLRDWLVLAVLLGAAGWLFRPPAQAFIDGDDASMYLAMGRMIARDGGLRTSDRTLAALPHDALPGLLSRDRTPPTLLNYFPGGIQATDDGKVELNFFHLVPVWMAAFDVAFGPEAACRVNAVFGVLAVAFVWAAGRRLSSRWSGAAAAGLLAVSFAEIWFARFPTTEVVTQAFVAGSLWALLVASDGGPTVAGTLAGLALGLGAFCRIDALVVTAVPLLAVAAGSVVLDRTMRAAWRPFLLAGVATTAYAAWHAWVFAGAYTRRVFTLLFFHRWRSGTGSLPVAIVLAVAAVLVWMLRSRLRLPRWFGKAVAGLAVAGLAALFVVGGTRVVANPFVVLVTPLGASLTALGLVALFVTPQPTRGLPLAVVWLASAFIYLQNPRDPTGFPMLLRRFVPVLLPLGSILVGHALATASRWHPARWMAVPLALVLGALWVRADRPLVGQPLFQGVYAALERTAESIPATALVFFDSGTPSHLALALHYQFDRMTVLVSGAGAAGVIGHTLEVMRQTGEPVLVAVSPDSAGTSRLVAPDFAPRLLRPRGSAVVSFEVPESSGTRLPRRTETVTHRVDFYEATEPPPGGEPLPLRIDIGAQDFGWIASGFHGPELMQGATARWTDGDARILVPPLAVPQGATMVVSSRLAAGRPSEAAPIDVEVDIGSEPAARFPLVSAGFKAYRVALTSGAAARLRGGAVLILRTPVFVPADHGTSTDRRRLGMAVDWIELGLDRRVAKPN